mgnify:CR=1 FL=1
MKTSPSYDMVDAIAKGNRMKVGDLVRFKDISSGASWGRGSFSRLEGVIGVLVGFSTCLAGNPMATFLCAMGKETFNVGYFEVISGS